MTISEDQRFRMHLELRKVLGDDVGNTVMEHLPPLGWGDVARSKDISHLSDRIDHVEQSLSARIDYVEQSLSARIDNVEKSLSTRIDNVEQSLSARIDQLSARIDHVEQRLKGITGTLWVMIGSMVTVSTGIIVMLVQINMNISSL
jgi:tetrahydromethanopterin S-methyltransferase subunit G